METESCEDSWIMIVYQCGNEREAETKEVREIYSKTCLQFCDQTFAGSAFIFRALVLD